MGLYRNYTNPQQFLTNSNEGQIIGNVAYNTSAISYFIILNVTNSANQLARINNIETLMGPYISEIPGGAVEASNPILSDSRMVSAYPGWDNVLDANSSRLIYLSGIVGALNSSNNSLYNSIWIYAQIHGSSYKHDNVAIDGVNYEQLPLQTFGRRPPIQQSFR